MSFIWKTMTDRVLPSERGDLGIWMRSFLTQGYISQIISVLILLSYNLLLPILLGLELYGQLVYVSASTYLIVALFDHGYNLLAIKNQRNIYYLKQKLSLTLVFLLFYSIYFLLAKPEIKLPLYYLIIIIAQTILHVLYTYSVHLQIANKRNDLFMKSSLINGGALLLVPILFYGFGFDIRLAPLFTIALSLLAICIFNKNSFSDFSLRIGTRKQPLKRKVKYLFLNSILQLKLSFGVVIDNLIVWAGVIYISDYGSYEYAASYRICMSIVSFLVLLLPMHKQSAYKAIIENKSDLWLKKYVLILVSFSMIMIVCVFIWGEQILHLLYPSDFSVIYQALTILVFSIPLKVILDLQIFVLNKHKNLDSIVKSSIYSGVISICGLYFLNMYQMIVIFYTVLVIANTYAYMKITISGSVTS